MKIFLSGATGYIGANLALKLADAGHTVHALIRDPAKAKAIKHSHIKFFQGDILNPADIKLAMDSCEAAFHLAAYARVWAKDPATYFTINVEGTKNILEAALSAGVDKLVYTSTAGVIGPSYELPADEETIRKVDFFNEYESSKSLAENWVQSYCDKGLKTIVVYPPRVYGPGLMSDSNAVTKLIQQYAIGKWKLLPGDGKKTGCYAFIDDVTDGQIKALLKGKPGERYILGGENSDYHKLFRLIRKHTGKHHKLYQVPLPAMLAFGNLQLLKNKITGKAPLLTPDWVKKYLYDWSLSSEKASKSLGYSITPLEEGVRKTVEWLKNNDKI